MGLKSKTTRSEIAFTISARTKAYARMYAKSKHLDLSKFMRGLIEEYLVEKKVLNPHGELINGWGDPSKMKEKSCPRDGQNHDDLIGIQVYTDSPLFVGLRHYSAGNSPDASNMSALLRFLVERELRRAEVLRENGQLTAQWKGRIENLKNRAA